MCLSRLLPNELQKLAISVRTPTRKVVKSRIVELSSIPFSASVVANSCIRLSNIMRSSHWSMGTRRMSQTNRAASYNSLGAKESETCPECGSEKMFVDSSRGEVTCSQCGIVIQSKMIDSGPEYRAFNSEEQAKRARVGSPMSYMIHDKGLSTMVGLEDTDIYGKRLSPSRRAQVYRLRKWQTRSRVHSASDRNLSVAMSELERLSSQLGIPRSVKETASVVYRKAIEGRLIRGRSIEAMTSAALYASTRIRRVPRTLDEVAEQSRITKKDLARCYRLLIKELEIKIPVPDPADYIVRFGAQLRLSGGTTRIAIDLLKEAKSKNLTAGKDPTGLAAATLYIAGIVEGERRTQKEIAKTATCTEVTVRNRYKELVKKLNIEIVI